MLLRRAVLRLFDIFSYLLLFHFVLRFMVKEFLLVQGVQEIFGLKRVQPWIHSTKDSICIFYGHLSNTEELLDRLHKGAFEDSGSSSSSLVSWKGVRIACTVS